MPKRIPPLSDRQVRNAKKRESPFKLFDGGGLYLAVTADGAKHWRMKHRRPDALAQASKDGGWRLGAIGVVPSATAGFDHYSQHSESPVLVGVWRESCDAADAL